MLIQKEVKIIIKNVAKNNNITEEEATQIWLSQWKLLKEKMQKAEFGDNIETIKFPKWGKYYTSQKKLKYIKSYLEQKEKRRLNKESNDKQDK